MQPQFHLLLPSCPCAGESVEQKRIQITNVRISSPKFGKGEICQGRRTPGACPRCAVSVHRHFPAPVWARLCFQQRDAAWAAHSESPGSHTASCRALQGCMAQLLGPRALAA